MKMRAMMMRPCGAVQLLDVEAEAGVDIGEDDDIDGNNDDRTIGDGGITVDFWIIKVHSFPLDHRILGIIKFLWIIKVHTFI